jgi:hypothetical protein
MLRAKLIGGVPADLVTSITGLTDGQFPVHAATRHAGPATPAVAATPAAPAVAGSTAHPAIDIYAPPGAPVVAVHDATVAAIGTSPSLGRFVTLRDPYGNIYIYTRLKFLARFFAVPRSSPATITSPPRLPLRDPAPRRSATAGHQAPVLGAPGTPPAATPAVAATTPPAPARGGPGATPAAARRFLATYGVRPGNVDLKPLIRGAHVIAGAILGRIGVTAPAQAPHLSFQIRPAGNGAPLIDPKPILDGWKLLEATAVDHPAAVGPAAQKPTIGQILLEGEAQLQQQVLADPSIDIYPCGRSDIAAGLIDRRVLAALELLAASGLKPGVSALRCGASPAGPTGEQSENASGNGVDISSINAIPVTGHQGAGSITDLMIRRLLTLQGSYRPSQIVSLMRYPGADDTFALPDHADRVHVGFAVPYDPQATPARQGATLLEPKQWLALVTRLGQIVNPAVDPRPSTAAIAIVGRRASAPGRGGAAATTPAAAPPQTTQWQPLDRLATGASPLDSIVPVR